MPWRDSAKSGGSGVQGHTGNLNINAGNPKPPVIPLSGWTAESNENAGFVLRASSSFDKWFYPQVMFARENASWATRGETENYWLEIEIPEKIRLGEIHLSSRSDTSPHQFVQKEKSLSFKVQASENRDSWLDISETFSEIPSKITPFIVDSDGAYKYFRVFIFSGQPSNPGLSYIQLFEHVAAAGLTVENMAPIIQRNVTDGAAVTDYDTTISHGYYPLAIVNLFVASESKPDGKSVPFKHSDGNWHIRTPDGFKQMGMSFFHRGLVK